MIKLPLLIEEACTESDETCSVLDDEGIRGAFNKLITFAGEEGMGIDDVVERTTLASDIVE